MQVLISEIIVQFEHSGTVFPATLSPTLFTIHKDQLICLQVSTYNQPTEQVPVYIMPATDGLSKLS
jgi:hypothetical protein